MRFLSTGTYRAEQQQPAYRTMASPTPTPANSTPVPAQYAGGDFIVGGGVAIFHVATGRVVICSAEHRRGKTYYFLPKGRRDAGEESGTGAEREGYEEVRTLQTPYYAHPYEEVGMMLILGIVRLS
jgi:hypothetical protein